MTIFIQIASYRDPELIPTIQDIIDKAKNPENLRIGVCRQYHPDDRFDNLDIYKKDKRFRIVDILFSKSKGCCWARNLTQKLYMGEKYTMQIDSHMRFLKDWDIKLIETILFLQKQGYSKPLLTGYVQGYEPSKVFVAKDNDPPLRMIFDKFTSEGVTVFKSEIIPYWEQLVCPVPAKFFAGGFSFTLGKFCQEVQYDPEIYFVGEEISISVRAFTHGYDLFHPHKTLLWHYYTRKRNIKQWDDDKTWYLKDSISYSKLRKLLGIENKGAVNNCGQFGLGTIRSLKDYEKYAGIQFSTSRVQ